jgi:hypothetical protein
MMGKIRKGQNECSTIFSCAICKKSCRGPRHSAWPTVPDGICCDKCHEEYGPVVLPLRECFKAWGMEALWDKLQARGK